MVNAGFGFLDSAMFGRTGISSKSSFSKSEGLIGNKKSSVKDGGKYADKCLDST